MSNTETSINIRTSKYIKEKFNSMIVGGATQTEKFEFLMKLLDETMEQQQYLDIKANVDNIKAKYEGIAAELNEIQAKATEWQNQVKDTYITGLRNEFDVVREGIELDEELKERIAELEKQLEKQTDDNIKLRNINGEYDTKVRKLEMENAELIKSEAKAIKEKSEAKDQALVDTRKAIELETKLEAKSEQLEILTSDLAKAREFEYKYNEISKELATIKNSKDNKLKAKDDEIAKLKAQLKAKDEEIEKLKPTKVETKTKSTTK